MNQLQPNSPIVIHGWLGAGPECLLLRTDGSGYSPGEGAGETFGINHWFCKGSWMCVRVQGQCMSLIKVTRLHSAPWHINEQANEVITSHEIWNLSRPHFSIYLCVCYLLQRCPSFGLLTRFTTVQSTTTSPPPSDSPSLSSSHHG